MGVSIHCWTGILDWITGLINAHARYCSTQFSRARVPAEGLLNGLCFLKNGESTVTRMSDIDTKAVSSVK